MRRQIALRAEILAGGDDADAKHLFPEAIGEDAGRQRVVFIDEPAGQARRVGRLAPSRQRREAGGRSRLHFFALIEVIAAMLQLRHAPLAFGQLLHDRHGRGRLLIGELLFDLSQLLPIRPTKRSDGKIMFGQLGLLSVGSFVRLAC